MGLDVELEDQELAEEIGLLGELIVAASQTTGALAESVVDAALGLLPVPAQRPAHTA